MLPDLFGHKGHVRVQQTHALIQYCSQNTRGSVTECFSTLHLHLGNLKIPVGKIRPEEIIDLSACFTKLELVNQSRDFFGQLRKATKNPTICQCSRLHLIDSGNTPTNFAASASH